MAYRSPVSCFHELDEYRALEFFIHEPPMPFGSSHGVSECHILMARSTENHGLTMAICHHLDPLRLFTAWISVEVFQCSNMMHLDGFCVTGRSTVFALLRQEPLSSSDLPPRYGVVGHSGLLGYPNSGKCSQRAIRGFFPSRSLMTWSPL